MRELVIYKPLFTSELKQWLFSARAQHKLTNQYRIKGQTSVMLKMLPGDNPTGKRFFQYDSIIENYVQLASIISSVYSQEQAIKTIETALGTFLKASLVSINQRDREVITDLCIFAILHPQKLWHVPLMPSQKEDAAFQKIKTEHFRAYYSSNPPEYDIFSLSPEQKLFFEVFAKPEEVAQQMEQFFCNVPALAAENRWSAIQIAAYVHNQIIKIHPFIDGNGRTARFMANQILLKYSLDPIIDVKKNKALEVIYDKMVASSDDHALVDLIASYQTSKKVIETFLPPVEYYRSYIYSIDNATNASPSAVQADLDALDDDALFVSRRPTRGLFFQPISLSYDLPADYLVEDAHAFKPKALDKLL